MIAELLASLNQTTMGYKFRLCEKSITCYWNSADVAMIEENMFGDIEMSTTCVDLRYRWESPVLANVVETCTMILLKLRDRLNDLDFDDLSGFEYLEYIRDEMRSYGSLVVLNVNKVHDLFQSECEVERRPVVGHVVDDCFKIYGHSSCLILVCAGLLAVIENERNYSIFELPQSAVEYCGL